MVTRDNIILRGRITERLHNEKMFQPRTGQWFINCMPNLRFFLCTLNKLLRKSSLNAFLEPFSLRLEKLKLNQILSFLMKRMLIYCFTLNAQKKSQSENVLSFSEIYK